MNTLTFEIAAFHCSNDASLSFLETNEGFEICIAGSVSSFESYPNRFHRSLSKTTNGYYYTLTAERNASFVVNTRLEETGTFQFFIRRAILSGGPKEEKNTSRLLTMATNLLLLSFAHAHYTFGFDLYFNPLRAMAVSSFCDSKDIFAWQYNTAWK